MPVSVDEAGRGERDPPSKNNRRANPRRSRRSTTSGGTSPPSASSSGDDGSHTTASTANTYKSGRPNALRRYLLGPRGRSNSKRVGGDGESVDKSGVAVSTPKRGNTSKLISPDQTEASTPPTSPESEMAPDSHALTAAEGSSADVSTEDVGASIVDNSNNNCTPPETFAAAEEDNLNVVVARDAEIILEESDSLCPPIPIEQPSMDDPISPAAESATGASSTTDPVIPEAESSDTTSREEDDQQQPQIECLLVDAKEEEKLATTDNSLPLTSQLPQQPLTDDPISPAAESAAGASSTDPTIPEAATAESSNSTSKEGDDQQQPQIECPLVDAEEEEELATTTDDSLPTTSQQTVGEEQQQDPGGISNKATTTVEEVGNESEAEADATELAKEEEVDLCDRPDDALSSTLAASGKITDEQQQSTPPEQHERSNGESAVANQEKIPPTLLSCEEKKDDAPRTVRNSEKFQKSLIARRRASWRSLDPSIVKNRTRSRKSNTRSKIGKVLNGSGDVGSSTSSSKSVGSVRSRRSTLSREGSICSMMSVQSYLSLSDKVQSLLELAADVVNSEHLKEASANYQKAIRAAGLEIMEINQQMGNLKSDPDPSSRSMKNSYHEDLRLIGIIIGLLRTKMAIVYAEDGDYDRAVELCKGANQVHKHQPALKVVNQKLEHSGDHIPGLMVVIIERLEKAQSCLEEHRELLKKIDLHSLHLEEYFEDDDLSIITSKEIVFSMLEGKATDDGSIVSYKGDDTLELLSVHAVEQDKHDMAINYLRDALQVHLVAMGTKRPQISQSLIRVANMYRGVGNNRKNEALVLGYFEQTASVLRHSNLAPRARGAVLNDIAVIHMRRKDYDEAIKFLLDALRAYDEEDIPVVDGKKARASIATLHVWRNLGVCYMALKQFRSAEGAFLKALDIQTESRRIQIAAEDLSLNIIGLEKSLVPLINDGNISDTICRVGRARAATGDHKRALEIYHEALSVINRNSAPSPDQTEKDLLEKSDQLCHILYCIAESCCELGDFEKALRMYSMSTSLRTSGNAYKNDKRKGSRVHCLLCFVGIGNVYAKAKEYPLALKQYKEALSYALASQIKETHPIVVSLNEHIKDVAKNMKAYHTGSSPLASLERKADNEIERGELDSATETLKELLVLRRSALQELKDKGEDTSEQVYAIACLLQTFGFVFAKNGDDENAERAFKDAARLFKKRGSSRVEL